MSVGGAVVTPEEALHPADAFALRRKRDAFVVDIRHGARPFKRRAQAKTTLCGPGTRLYSEHGRAIAAGVVAIGPQIAHCSVESEVHHRGLSAGQRRDTMESTAHMIERVSVDDSA